MGKLGPLHFRPVSSPIVSLSTSYRGFSSGHDQPYSSVISGPSMKAAWSAENAEGH